MRQMGLEAVGPKPRTTRRAKQQRIYPYLLRDFKVTAPDQVWSTDITYIPLAEGYLYLTAVLDWYSRYVLAWFGASCFWLILAPVLGLVAAAKLDDPLLLPDIHWLQFGRMRIAHVNGVIFGFFSTAIFGFMAYAVPKLTQRPLTSMRAAWWGFAIFNVGVVVGEDRQRDAAAGADLGRCLPRAHRQAAGAQQEGERAGDGAPPTNRPRSFRRHELPPPPQSVHLKMAASASGWAHAAAFRAIEGSARG